MPVAVTERNRESHVSSEKGGPLRIQPMAAAAAWRCGYGRSRKDALKRHHTRIMHMMCSETIFAHRHGVGAAGSLLTRSFSSTTPVPKLLAHLTGSSPHTKKGNPRRYELCWQRVNARQSPTHKRVRCNSWTHASHKKEKEEKSQPKCTCNARCAAPDAGSICSYKSPRAQLPNA